MARLSIPRRRRRQCAWCPRIVAVQGYARHQATHWCVHDGRYHTQGGFVILHGALVRVFGARQARRSL